MHKVKSKTPIRDALPGAIVMTLIVSCQAIRTINCMNFDVQSVMGVIGADWGNKWKDAHGFRNILFMKGKWTTKTSM